MSMDLLFTLRVPSMRTDREHTITIQAFDAYKTGPHGHSQIDVRVLFTAKGGKPVEIFPRGATYCGMPCGSSIDGDEAKELVCSLIAMKPGDTDREFFDSYTPEQLSFVKEYGEELSQYCERWRCSECGAVTGRSKDRWTGKRCAHHRKERAA
jgi:hypothetical protein